MPKETAALMKAAEGEEAPATRKPSQLLLALAAAVCCGGAGAASYLFAPAVLGERLANATVDEKAAGAGHSAKIQPEKKQDKHGGDKAKEKKGDADAAKDDAGAAATFSVVGAKGVYVLRPIVVSLKPHGRVRYLKVTLAVETSPESENAFIDNELRIIDILTSYLRAVPVSAIEDPVAMARIREQIARRIFFIVEPAPVDAVLITDFILS